MSATIDLRLAAMLVLAALTAPRATGSAAEDGPPAPVPRVVERFMGRIERYLDEHLAYLEEECIGGGLTRDPQPLFWIPDPRHSGQWFVGYSFGRAGNHQELCERLARVNRDGIAMEDLSDIAGDEAVVFRLDHGAFAIATVGHGHWGGGPASVCRLDDDGPHPLLSYPEAMRHASNEASSCDSYLLFCDVDGRDGAEIIVRQVEHDPEERAVRQRYGLYRLAPDANRYDLVVEPSSDQRVLRARYIASRAGGGALELLQCGPPWVSDHWPDVGVDEP